MEKDNVQKIDLRELGPGEFSGGTIPQSTLDVIKRLEEQQKQIKEESIKPSDTI